MSDIVINAGDGTHRIIEADAIRALIGYVEQRDGAPTVDEQPAEACCDIHNENGCCDPDDCGPCCPTCPTCPVVRAGNAPAALTV